MPIDLPGYYFDAEKNRYFPLSSRKQQDPKPSVAISQEIKPAHLLRDLLLEREITGNHVGSFRSSVLETHCTQPKTWFYPCQRADGALDGGYRRQQGEEGIAEQELLLLGGIDGITAAEVIRDDYRGADVVVPERFSPKNSTKHVKKPPSIRMTLTFRFFSSVTAVKLLPNNVVMLSTLGSGESGGTLNLMEIKDDGLETRLSRRISGSLWTADCFPCATKASIGTSYGADIVDLKMNRITSIHKSKSSVLSQKIESTGNILFCGSRNGSILSFDLRQNSRNMISMNMRMRSAVCSMLLLPSDENYLISSAMDGCIWLWDRRLVSRGAMGSFDGNVNTHSMLRLGIDPTQTLLVSGGEDCCVRLWSLRTKQLLHIEEDFPEMIKTVYCPGLGMKNRERNDDDAWRMWCGSSGRVYRMQGSMH